MGGSEIGQLPYMATLNRPPPTLLGAPKGGLGVAKMAQKGRLLAQNYVVDQNSKDFLENLKYFLGSKPIFEKK